MIIYATGDAKSGRVIYDPHLKLYVSSGKLTLKENEIDSLTLSVNQNNYLFGKAKPFKTHAEVYQDNFLIFRGRCLQVSREMKDNGQFIQQIIFEDIQNYLQDSMQRWEKVQNTTPKQFFQKLIDYHNTQSEAHKKFIVRNVDVTNSTDNVYRYINDGATTWETIKDKLISRLGGYIVVEHKDGKNYIDYVKNPGINHYNTPIKIGKNMQSASVQIDPTEIITRLIPLGAMLENSDTSDVDTSQPRVDIGSVNNGYDYIDIPELEETYGYIAKSVIWDDVHEPNILLTKAKQWINKQVAAKESYQIQALELPEFDSFNVSDRHPFINPNVSENKLLRITQKEIDLQNWYKSTLTISDRSASLSQFQANQADQLRQVMRYKSKVYEYNNSIANLHNEINNNNRTLYPWSNKKVTILGDSISYGTFSWTNQLKTFSKFSEINNLSAQNASISTINSHSFIEQAEQVANQDLVIVFGGIEDFAKNVPLGDFTDSSTGTFFGALKNIVQTILDDENNRIMLITPLVETSLNYPTYDNSGALTKNNIGLTQKDYADAIKRVASYYSFSIMDLMSNCIINPIGRPELFQDGIVPTETGSKMIGEQIAKQVNII